MALDPALAIEDIAPGKSNKKLLIVFILLLLIAAGAGAAYYFTHQQPEPKVVKEEAPKAPIFLTLDTFTVNLQPDAENQNQYLQVDISLKVDELAESDLIKLHMPQVRDRLLLLLSSKKGAEISSIEGKKTLGNEIIAQLNQPFSAEGKEQHVNGVFFTSFVIQ